MASQSGPGRPKRDVSEMSYPAILFELESLGVPREDLETMSFEVGKSTLAKLRDQVRSVGCCGSTM